MHARVIVVAVILAAIPALARTQAQPPRDAAAKAATGTGTLSGRVTALDTGKPIRRAQILVSSPTLLEGKAVSSDADGRWSLTGLPAARYTIAVSKNGFVGIAYGQRRPFASGTPVDLAAAATLAKLDVALPRAGAVNGRVVDEAAEPVANARVSVQRYGFNRGQRQLVNVGNVATTDDLGAFRVHGLPAGEYFLSAVPPTGPFMAATDDRAGYTRTYYPDALSVSQATRLTVRPGEDVRELLVAMTPTRMVTLSGTAVDSAGKPLAKAVGALRERPNRMALARTFTVSDGTWKATGVLPGDYVLSVQWMESFEQVAVTGSTRGMKREFADLPITVTGQNVSGIHLVTSPAGIAAGRLRFEGDPPAPAVLASAYVHGVDATGYEPAASARIAADGTFRLEGLDGERVFRVSEELSRSWIIKAVSLKGQDVTDTPVSTPLGVTVAGLEITLTRAAAEVSGTVTDAKGAPATEYVVVMFPPVPERWGTHSRLIKTARPDSQGRFAITHLPAESYLVAAVEFAEPGEETSPEFLEALKANADKLTLAEGEKKTITLKLVSK